jgi:TraY domain
MRKNFGGRPGRKPKPGERVHLGFRVSPELRKKLAAAATSSTRSLSQEIELRLENSFGQDEAFGGPGIRAIGLLMASTFTIHGQRKAAEVAADKDWTNNQECYVAGLAGVIAALVRNAPAEISPLENQYLIGSWQTALAQQPRSEKRGDR